MSKPMQRHTYQKAKNFKRAWGSLISYSKRHIALVVIAMIFAVAGAVTTIIGPDKIKDITNLISDGLGGTLDMAGITRIAIMLVIIYGVSVICSYIQGYIMAGVTQGISKRLRTDISKKINRLPLKYLDAHSYGDILSRVTNDVDLISQSLNNSVVTLVSSSALLVGAVVMMFVTNWIMALSAICSSILGFVIVAIILSKSQKYFNAQQESLGELNGHIEEVYSGHNVIKAYNAEKEVRSEFDGINKKLYSSAWKSQFYSGLMMPLMGFIGHLGYTVVCIVGAILMASGHIDFGVITGFMIYVRLFTQPLNQLAQAFTNLQSTAAASERVFEFLGEQELEDESYKTERLDKVKGNVVFQNVKFGYDENKTIIHDFSAEIKAGQKVAIVGPTGAGKTTMVNLLMRFYELNSGNIFIDGVPISELTRENVHELFSMVLQDTWLFEGTVKENIVYSKENVSDEEIVEACKACGIHHFIKTLPHAYDTILDENTSISAGQKQLLTIARAMMQNSPMLILDEATSSVDTRTEELIQKAMDKLSKGRTSFVIAHRLSTIKNADLILYMRDGDIKEQGTHEELMAKSGMYAELYNSQFAES